MALSHYQSNQDADEVDLNLIHSLLLSVCGLGVGAERVGAAGAGASEDGPLLEKRAKDEGGECEWRGGRLSCRGCDPEDGCVFN